MQDLQQQAAKEQVEAKSDDSGSDEGQENKPGAKRRVANCNMPVPPA